MAGNFNPLLVGDRTVRDWLPLCRSLEAITPTVGDAQERQAVVDLVVRVLYAARAAAAAGRISAGQETVVLAAWNATWGALAPPVIAASITDAIELTNQQVFLAVVGGVLDTTLIAWDNAWS